LAAREEGRDFLSGNSAILGVRLFAKRFNKNKTLLLFFLPVLVYMIIFKFLPMYGLVVSFYDYNLFKGLPGSQFVGLKYYRQFVSSPDFLLLCRNTFLLGLYRLAWSFPAPVLLALLISQIRTARIQKAFQTVTYLPYFLSTPVVVSMIYLFLSPTGGMVNNFIALLGGQKINFLGEAGYFRTIYIASEVWQRAGMSSIIYLAALSAIDPQLYESAVIDGANKFRQILHVTLPGIATTLIIMFIISTGDIVSIGFEKAFLLQNPANTEVSDVFNTYVYRVGLTKFNYSSATAAGLFQSVIALVFVFASNRISKRATETSIV
jgi:putative aldouronate transport system permease protein